MQYLTGLIVVMAFLAIASWLIWQIVTGKTLDGIILFAPGAVHATRRMMSEQLRVQAFRSRRNQGTAFVRLELVATTPLSYQSMPIELRLSEARELVRLVQDAIKYFENQGNEEIIERST